MKTSRYSLHSSRFPAPSCGRGTGPERKQKALFENKQIQGLEDHVTIYKQEEPSWELDEYQLQRLKELGLTDEEPKQDDFISRL